MAKDPAFLFYPNDWIGGTMGMTFEEKGAYIELLMAQFNRGHMTKHMIGQIVGQVWDNIKDKFKVDDKGLYFNERLEEEQMKRKKYSESRRNNKSGNNQHTNKSKKKRGHVTSHMENEDENENKDINGTEKPREKKEPNINYLVKEAFEEQYLIDREIEYEWTPKDWGQSKLFIAKLKSGFKKKFNKDATDDEILNSALIVFQQLPEWYKQNGYSIPILNSKYNEIINQLKNGKGSKIKQLNDIQSGLAKIDALPD